MIRKLLGRSRFRISLEDNKFCILDYLAPTERDVSLRPPASGVVDVEMGVTKQIIVAADLACLGTPTTNLSFDHSRQSLLIWYAGTTNPPLLTNTRSTSFLWLCLMPLKAS